MTQAVRTLPISAPTESHAAHEPALAALWSRSGGLLTGSAKSDVQIKVWLPSELADELTHEARRHGMTTSEFLRVVVAIRIRGLDALSSATAKQLAEIAGVGAEKALP